MDVERELGERLDRLDDGRAEGDVRHEMTVHDVDVEEIGMGLVDARTLGAEIAEIGRDDGRGDEDGFHEVIWGNACGGGVVQHPDLGALGRLDPHDRVGRLLRDENPRGACRPCRRPRRAGGQPPRR